MWYVVQVRTGDERKLADRLKLEVKADDEEIFVPLFERRKCFKGEWTKVTTPLFPGYIFFQTNDVESFYLRLKKINAFTKILGTESGYSPISADEERFLRILIGDDYIAQEGYAAAVATYLDQHPTDSILGTLAGDDTVLLGLRQGYTPKQVLAALEQCMPGICSRATYPSSER